MASILGCPSSSRAHGPWRLCAASSLACGAARRWRPDMPALVATARPILAREYFPLGGKPLPSMVGHQAAVSKRPGAAASSGAGSLPAPAAGGGSPLSPAPSSPHSILSLYPRRLLLSPALRRSSRGLPQLFFSLFGCPRPRPRARRVLVSSPPAVASCPKGSPALRGRSPRRSLVVALGS